VDADGVKQGPHPPWAGNGVFIEVMVPN